jgi:hypothetical protein
VDDVPERILELHTTSHAARDCQLLAAGGPVGAKNVLGELPGRATAEERHAGEGAEGDAVLHLAIAQRHGELAARRDGQQARVAQA